MALTANLTLSVSAEYTKAGDLSGTATSSPKITLNDSLADGTAADKADLVYFDATTMIADAKDSYDLAGTLTDIFAATITAARVKCICVKNTSTTASVIMVGGGTGGDGTNAFDTWISSTGGGTDSLKPGCEGVLVRPGGVFLLWAPGATGYVVTAATADILMVQEQSTLAAIYDIMVIMASA